MAGFIKPYCIIIVTVHSYPLLCVSVSTLEEAIGSFHLVVIHVIMEYWSLDWLDFLREVQPVLPTFRFSTVWWYTLVAQDWHPFIKLERHNPVTMHEWHPIWESHHEDRGCVRFLCLPSGRERARDVDEEASRVYILKKLGFSHYTLLFACTLKECTRHDPRSPDPKVSASLCWCKTLGCPTPPLTGLDNYRVVFSMIAK